MDQTLSLALATYKGAIVLLFLLTFLLAGWLIPFVKTAQKLSRIGKNLALAGLNGVLSMSVIVPIIAFASHWSLLWRPDWMQGWRGLMFDLVVLDCWIYWWHRAAHVLPILWRFHEVHHLDETLDASSALRFHFGEVLISSLVRAPFIVLLAIPLSHVLLFETLVASAAIFHHANLRLPPNFERLLSYIIVTPSIHWVHHHAKRADTDSNYAVFLSLWDRLFGSRSQTKRTAEMRIGVEGKSEQSLLKLIAWPWAKDRSG